MKIKLLKIMTAVLLPFVIIGCESLLGDDTDERDTTVSPPDWLIGDWVNEQRTISFSDDNFVIEFPDLYLDFRETHGSPSTENALYGLDDDYDSYSYTVDADGESYEFRRTSENQFQYLGPPDASSNGSILFTIREVKD